MPEVPVQVTTKQGKALQYLATQAGSTPQKIVDNIFGHVLKKSLQNALKMHKSSIEDINELGLTQIEQAEMLAEMLQAKEDYIANKP